MKARSLRTGNIIEVNDEVYKANPGLFQPVNDEQPAQAQTKTMTGYSPETIYQGIQKARMAGDKAAETDLLDMYTKESQYQKDVASGAYSTPEQKAAEKAKANAEKYKNDIIGIATQLQNTIANKSQYKPEEYRAIIDSYTSALTAKQKEASNFGASLTGNELAILAGQIPVREEIGRSIGSTINQAITGKVPAQTGRVIDTDEQILRKLAILIPQLQGKDVSPDMFGRAQQQAAQPSVESKSLQGLAGNAQKNAYEILNSLLNIPSSVVGNIQDKYRQGQTVTAPGLIAEGAFNLGKGIVNEANELTGRPLEGGDILGRILNRAYEKPVSTVLDILPFIKTPKGLTGTTEAIEAGREGELINTLKKGAAIGEEGNIITKGAERFNEVLTGGGPKDLIAKNVMLDEAQSLSKSLLDHNIQGQLTNKGKIVKTQQALSDVGSNLEKIYKASPKKWTGQQLNRIIEDTLKKEYGSNQISAPLIQQVKDTITQRGGFDITKNDSVLTAEDVWKLKKSGEEFGKAAYNFPKTGPLMQDMAKRITSILRDELAREVPKAVPELRDYGNLRSYMDDVLKDPRGLNVNRGGVIRGGVDTIRKLLELGTQGIYNLGK